MSVKFVPSACHAGCRELDWNTLAELALDWNAAELAELTCQFPGLVRQIPDVCATRTSHLAHSISPTWEHLQTTCFRSLIIAQQCVFCHCRIFVESDNYNIVVSIRNAVIHVATMFRMCSIQGGKSLYGRHVMARYPQCCQIPRACLCPFQE